MVKIGDQVVPHSDWLSKVRKNKSHTHIVFYIVVPFYYEVMANSDRLSKVKEMFFFTFFCLFTFITSLFQLSGYIFFLLVFFSGADTCELVTMCVVTNIYEPVTVF